MLENKCPTCGRNLSTGYKCPVCSVYVPPKQNMTTPTKEQITEILGQMQKRGLYWDGIDYEDEYAVLRFIITEWEKIRNSPK